MVTIQKGTIGLMVLYLKYVFFSLIGMMDTCTKDRHISSGMEMASRDVSNRWVNRNRVHGTICTPQNECTPRDLMNNLTRT